MRRMIAVALIGISGCATTPSTPMATSPSTSPSQTEDWRTKLDREVAARQEKERALRARWKRPQIGQSYDEWRAQVGRNVYVKHQAEYANVRVVTLNVFPPSDIYYVLTVENGIITGISH